LSTTPSLNDLIAQAERLITDGQPAAAKSLVQDAYKLDRTNPDVLVLVAQVSTAPDVQRNALHKALATNPNHRKARELLARMQTSGSVTMPGVLPPPTPSSARLVPTPLPSSSKRGLSLVALLIGGIVVVLALVGGALALSGARTPATTIAQAPTLAPITRSPVTAPLQNTAIPATQGAVAIVVTIAPTMTPLPLVASPTVSILAPVGNAIELTATTLNQQIATTLIAATERARPTQPSAQQSTLLAQVGATQTALAAGSFITGTIYVNADGSAVLPPDPHVVMINITYNGKRQYPVLSPNGKLVTFSSVVPGNTRGADVFVANVDGTELKTIATEIPGILYPEWSPDSRQVALVSWESTLRSAIELRLAAVDGSLVRMLMAAPYYTSIFLAWSPDSRAIAIRALKSEKDKESAIFVVEASSGVVRQVSPMITQDQLPEVLPWSPDGKWIAWQTSLGTGIHLISRDGAVQRVLPLNEVVDFANDADHGKSLKWSPDSRQVAFTASAKSDATRGVVIQSISDGKSVFYPKVGLSNVMGLKGFGFWSPDGQYFSALSRNEVVFLRADGGEARRFALPVADDGAYNIGVWSPDSKFAVVSFAVDKKPRTVFVPVEGGTPLPFDVGGRIEAWLP